MSARAQIRPSHPSTWLFGEAGGIQVWAAMGDPSVSVSVLIGDSTPVIILNQLVAGTAGEYGAIAWAFSVVAAGVAGFFVRRD